MQIIEYGNLCFFPITCFRYFYHSPILHSSYDDIYSFYVEFMDIYVENLYDTE